MGSETISIKQLNFSIFRLASLDGRRHCYPADDFETTLWVNKGSFEEVEAVGRYCILPRDVLELEPNSVK